MQPAKFAALLALGLLCACSRANEPVDLQALAGQARGGDEKAMKKLVELLAVDTNAVNDQVYRIVIETGPAMIPVLLEEVKSPNASQREHVIASLGTLKSKEAVRPITEILVDPGVNRRYVAAWALGQINDPAGIPALIKALDDSDPEVRKFATRSLIKLNTEAVQPLIDALPGLGREGGAGAIRALGDISDPRAVSALLTQAHGANRSEIFLALGKIKDPRAEQTLITGLSDPDWQVRMNAAMALGPLNAQAAVAPLRRTLEDPVHVVREWSARSLEMILGERMTYRNEKGEYVAPYNVYH